MNIHIDWCYAAMCLISVVKITLPVACADDKSRVLDIDNADPHLFPEFHRATRYECSLQPGDVLFIPGFDSHSAFSPSTFQ